jgi:UDP-glucose 4-epimerase
MTQAGKVVLVTGVSRDLGRRFARNLADDPAVARVIGVDVTPPTGDIGAVSFLRADLRNPVVAKILVRERVDTVVHMSVIATPAGVGSRSTMKESNVIGTMQLLGACQRAPDVRRLVVKSTTTVYGASHRDPALFTEDMGPKRMPRSGYSRDALEVEGYVRGFQRRRPDVSVVTLRAANVIGPEVDSPIAQYFRLPVVPSVLGFDPRLQFIHELDLMGALRRAVFVDDGGTYNLAGDGVLLLSQAIRRLGRTGLPVPSFALSAVGSAMRGVGRAEFAPELVHFLTYGRGVDTTRLRTEFGFTPRFSSAQAFCDFARSLGEPGAFRGLATAEPFLAGLERSLARGAHDDAPVTDATGGELHG